LDQFFEKHLENAKDEMERGDLSDLVTEGTINQ